MARAQSTSDRGLHEGRATRPDVARTRGPSPRGGGERAPSGGVATTPMSSAGARPGVAPSPDASPAVAPHVEAPPLEVHVHDTEVFATDGYPLAATLFESTRQDAPLVIVNGATGVPRRFYRRFAHHLAERGFDVLTYDYRGIGGSRPASFRGFEARMSDWGAKDFAGVLEHAERSLGRARVHVVGHSVGGQVLGLAEGAASRVDRVVAIAAQLGDYRLWPGAQRARMGLLWYVVIPLATRAFGYLPGAIGIGEDLPAGVADEWRTWCTTPGYFLPIFGRPLEERFASYRSPMLVYSTEADPYGPRAAVDAWRALFTSADARRVHLEDARLGHFGFFRPELGLPRWDEVVAFLREPSDLTS